MIKRDESEDYFLKVFWNKSIAINVFFPGKAVRKQWPQLVSLKQNSLSSNALSLLNRQAFVHIV